MSSFWLIVLYQLSQPVVEACYLNAGSFALIATVCGSLVTGISAIFGLLMLSYRGRIASAEEREQGAYKERDRANDDRDEAMYQRNEALWRLNEARENYRDITQPPGRRRSLGQGRST